MKCLKLIKNVFLCMLITLIMLFTIFMFDKELNADTLNLDNLSVDYTQYFPGGTDPLLTQNANLPNRTLGQRLELNVDVSILGYLYWNNLIHASTDSVINNDGSTCCGQFRLIGLQSQLGIRLTDNFYIGYYHHSEHLLDTNWSYGRFPVSDGIELKLIIYKDAHRTESLF